MRLRIVFAILLCGQLGLGGAQMLLDAYRTEPQAQADHADMKNAAAFLMESGYTHGYGNFWTVRVVEELTEGKLTFAGVNFVQTEEGAACPMSLDMIRWLEPDDASHMDVCEGKVFLLLSHQESETLAPWLEMAGAPMIYEDSTYRAYHFESSQALHNQAMFLRMKLENARCADGVFELDAKGRMRVPTGYREAGEYVLSFACEGAPDAQSRVQVYTTRHFQVLAGQEIVQGENELRFALEQEDQYFMILFTGAEDGSLVIGMPELDKIK